MRMTLTDRDAAERGAVRLGWMLILTAVLVLAVLTTLGIGALVGGLSPAREGAAAVLGWADTSWLNAATIGTAAAVAGVVAPFLIRWLDRRRPIEPVGPTWSVQDRTTMLRRVRYQWITSVLEPSLAGTAHLVLGLEHRREMLDRSGPVVRYLGRPPAPLAQGTSISNVLDDVGGGLLILGESGSGKTTLLLQLCDELLDRADRDSSQPIPVVMNLSSWACQRPALGVWLVEQLARDYYVPRQLATAWVEHNALALLLDGLDEVASPHRVACAEAINAWREEHGLVPLVVCGRTNDLQVLASRLRLDEAVELQPPSDAQIDAYLRSLEATGTPLAEVRAAIATDEGLKALLRSPLLLHVVTLAYQGRPASELQTPGSANERQSLLWEAYLARMFERRPLDPGEGYTSERARGWLAWLAGQLQDRDQAMFHLDRLDLDWLATRTQQRHARIAAWLVGGPFFGLVAGLVGGLGLALVVGPVYGLALGLVAGLWLGALIGLTGRSSTPTEELHWSPQRLIGSLAGGIAGGLFGGLVSTLVLGLQVLGRDTLAGLGVGILCGLFGGMIGLRTQRGATTERLHRPWWDLAGGLAVGLLAGLGLGLGGGLGGGVAYGLVYGLLRGLAGELRDERTRPNEGIRRSAQYAVVVGLATALSVELGIGLALGPYNQLAYVLASTSLLAVLMGLAAGMAVGGHACVWHYAIRAVLVHAGVTPWRYGWFLEAMTERLLLRRNGAAYLFIHRLLLDHLAGRYRASATVQHGARDR